MPTTAIDTWIPITGPHGAAGRRNLATGQTLYMPIAAEAFTEQRPGHDGEQVEQLLAPAKRQALNLIHQLAKQALQRILERVQTAESPAHALLANIRFFDTAELAQFADLLKRINVTADLLGRARIRFRQHDQTPPGQPTNFRRLEKFDELDRLRPLPPLQAIDYFRGLTPGLKLDLFQFDLPSFEQHAFTLAVTTDEKILERVQAIVLERLETGKALSTAPAQIDEILDEAGIGPVRNGYGEMVLRTNMMESYRTGSWREYSDPDLAEDYPVWRYIGIHDGRERHGNDPHAHRPAPADKPDHLRWFGQHFARSVVFSQVRGENIADIANCRCDFVPIYKTDVKKLLMQGMRPIDNWQEIKAADTYTEDLWFPYIGPHHGHGWQNRHTGAIIYGDHHPGSHHALAKARAEGHTWHAIAQRTGLPVTTIRARLRAHNRITSGLPAGLKSKAASPEAYHRAEGDPTPLDENEAYRRAFHILAEQHYESSTNQEAVPFTEKWAPYHGPKGGEGWRNLATGEILYQKEEPAQATVQGRPQGNSLYLRGSKWADVFRARLQTINQVHGASAQYTAQIRDQLVQAYTTAVHRRIEAIRHQIIERHGKEAIDLPAWKKFLHATAPNRKTFEDEYKDLAHAMADDATAHSKTPDAYAAREKLHAKLLDHKNKLSRAAARHADALVNAHIALVRELKEHYAKSETK